MFINIYFYFDFNKSTKAKTLIFIVSVRVERFESQFVVFIPVSKEAFLELFRETFALNGIRDLKVVKTA